MGDWEADRAPPGRVTPGRAELTRSAEPSWSCLGHRRSLRRQLQEAHRGCGHRGCGHGC